MWPPAKILMMMFSDIKYLLHFPSECMMLAWALMIGRNMYIKWEKDRKDLLAVTPDGCLPLSPGPVRVGVRQAADLLSQARHNVIMYHFLNYISTLMPSRDQPTHPGQPVLSAFCLVKNLPRVRVETEKEHHHRGKLNFHWLLLEDETKTFIPVGLWKCTKVVHHLLFLGLRKV